MSLFLEFLKNPMTVGAIAPSGPALARVATAVVPRTGSPVVVELGPGTGAFTDAVQQRLAGRGQHIALEINPRFAEQLAARHPAVDVVNADAATLETVLAQRGLRRADAVVSGLPWAAYAEDQQRSVLSGVVAALPPGGVFTTFAYVHARWAPPARRLLHSLQARFDEVVISRTVWANLPPALVYYCRRPRTWFSADVDPTSHALTKMRVQ
ncbi:methyltransferase domain-containing protein [Micromonospora sp. WMMD1082]|uniref:class I SAM-dependent methyltransferase n=1 Tax=Micromonospora sp. WMMD1082 TaxID=3016104 RepID=UPI00241630E0|nr:methyltransferase domain-containing protein [Micromonospora sp. WMMD1082]MDG4798322.1 methyltransferase domain-containing protein [Micromonospora sp. WMMD1082]